ncbi:MAG: glycosyltransferase family 2 protein, partial [Rhodospirillales bacterium]|nr:glycosyltransferase family 2 protein [Rhodospirillales bacterium]
MPPPSRRAARRARVSVVVPTYNRAARLAALLRCLEEQPAPSSFEVLVCDDGSTDGTREVAALFGRRLRLRYLFQPDEGFRAGAARNLGIDAAKGDLVLFLDDDQLVAPDFLDAHRRAHRDAAGPALVVGPRHRADAFDRPPASVDRIRAYPQDSRAVEIGPDGEGLAAAPHPGAYAF